ncbi:MAG: response regulator [Thermoguttaceae bacterium]
MTNNDALVEGHDDLVDAESGVSLSFRPRILLAEDEPDHQRLISHILRNMGADVTIVENGQTAVGLALQAQEEGIPFDLILMDIQMPVMDGYQATRHLHEAGYRLPVVAVTANAMAGDREKFIEAGGDDYISKPFVVSEIANLVKRLARQARPRISLG